MSADGHRGDNLHNRDIGFLCDRLELKKSEIRDQVELRAIAQAKVAEHDRLLEQYERDYFECLEAVRAKGSKA